MKTDIEIIGAQTEINAIQQVERAKFIDRFFAAFVDNVIYSISMRGISFLIWTPLISKQTTDRGVLIYSALCILFNLFCVIGYFAGYAYMNGGQTIGKKWNKIKVVNLNGENLKLLHFIYREIIARGVPMLAYLIIGEVAYLWYLTYLLALRKDRRAMHDIFTETQVITVKNSY